MNLSRVFVTAMLVGTLAMFGCGSDSGGGGGSGGGGNTNGGGGDPACNVGGCVDNPTQREICETAVAACRAAGIAVDQCIAIAVTDACEMAGS